jgi:hypothetical protein
MGRGAEDLEDSGDWEDGGERETGKTAVDGWQITELLVIG